MLRRDISKILIATAAAGTAANTKVAEAQTCTAPCYAQTAAEIAAGVTPVYTQYPPDPLIDPRRYGGDPTGTSDSTAAIQAAVAVQAINHCAILINGRYLYSPSARLDLKGDLIGIGVSNSALICNTSSYTGEFFRLLGNYEISNLTIETSGLTRLGTGVYCAADPTSGFTGNQRLSRVYISGFNINLQLGDVYQVILDQLTSQYGNYGEYCVPDPAGGGYVCSVLHIACFYNANTQNIYYSPSVNSMNVSFYGGAIQDSTGATFQSYFNNVFTLKFESIYTEGNPTQPWLACNAVTNLSVDGLTNNGGGSLSVGSGSNTKCNFKNVLATSSTCVLNVGVGNYLTMENCAWPLSGNSYPSATTTMINTVVNGSTIPSRVSGFGTPTGASVVANFPGSSATLTQTSQTVAELISILLAKGVIGS